MVNFNEILVSSLEILRLTDFKLNSCVMAAASGARSGWPVHTISRFVCVGCESQGEFRHTYASRRGASIHASKTPVCRRLGLGIREIRVPAGSAADVMAGGGGAAGPAPDVRHQPPGTQ